MATKSSLPSKKSLPVPAVKCPVCSVSHRPVDGDLQNGVYAGNCQNCGFFFKFRAVSDTADSVTFNVNGAPYTVGNEFDPATSLNEWLRTESISVGTKQLCLEGGCGVCLVAVKLYEPITMLPQVYAVNSCLVQLYQCDGWEITTIEGLGNPTVGLHPIQQRMVQYNGSQCGFCTPGQIMNMYGFLQKNTKPTKQQIEDNTDSTICRCTGYRPILDAMKSFAVDASPVDIEDLKPKMCEKSGKPCEGKCKPRKGKRGQAVGEDQAGSRPLHIVGDRAQWFKPTTLEALYALLKQYRDANYRLVFGNTGYGVYKDIGPWMYDVLIDLRGVKALYGIDFDSDVVLGANLSLSNLEEIFTRVAPDPSVHTFFPQFAAHTKMIASNSVRNLGCWAGNLMLKHKHPEFPSDVFCMFETIGTQLFLVDQDQNESQVSLEAFLNTDMKGKIILACVFKTDSLRDDVYVRLYRVTQRLQMSHGYVVAGFNFQLDKDNNFQVKVKPTMVFQGISSTLNHATKTEDFLTGKQLGDPQVLIAALNQLSQEIVPTSDPVLPAPQYIRNLACALFYKFVLDVCGTKAAQSYRSGGTMLYRPVSSAMQTYSTRKEEWPLNEPMTKIEAQYQACGEAKYLMDAPLAKTELYAAFVLTTQGNAHIASVDPSPALAMSGVYKVIQAADIPGANNFFPASFQAQVEELLCSGQVLYAGQPLAIVVASDKQTADTAASMVKVTYSNVQKAVTDLKEAIQNKSFYPNPPDPVVVGNPDQAIAGSAKRVSGTLQMGTQAHFHMETQGARCAPNDDGGMNVEATTQWMDACAEAVSEILKINQSSVTVEVKRLGGAFGGKITRNFMVAGGCALAAHIMQRPIRLDMNIHSNFQAIGKRYPYYCEYQVGFTDEGKLNGVEVTMYADCGSSPNDSAIAYAFPWLSNAYNCPNWKFTAINVKTNKAANTACRSPGSLPTQFLMESMMEHVAKSLSKNPSDVRKLNFYKKGDVTPDGMRLDYCNMGPVVTQLETSCDYVTRKSQVAQFNMANRWKKRGLSMVPTRFGIGWGGVNYNVFLAIYHSDGTIAIEHAGIEVGQGINTKTAQVCSYELGVPMSLIRVKKVSTVCNANSTTTGGSITSELNCMGVVECCKILRSRMDPVRQQMKNPTWQELVTACYRKGLDLTAHFYTNPYTPTAFRYNVYAAVVTEAEVDVLTGQSQIVRADMLYDCGESLNPELDIGQIEGGFMMGLGYHLTEKEKFDPATGQLLTDGTWEYKPPMCKDLPIDFRITLLDHAPNPLGVLRSKAAGEPPLMMSSSGLFAIKHAIEAARAEIGQDTFFTLNSPCLVEDVQSACKVDITQFTFGN